MTAVAWACLATALLLVPMASPGVPRAHALADRGRLPGALRTARAAAGSPATAIVLATAVLVVAVTACGGAALGLAAAVASATGGRLGLQAMRARVRDRSRGALLAAVRLMAAELEAGSSPATALEAAAALTPEHSDALQSAAARSRAGDDPQLPGAELVGLAHAWRLSASTGVPLAQVCARVAADLAAQVEQRRAVTAALAGARSSAALLAGLPIVGLLLGTAMQAQPVHVLLATPAGRSVCLAGVCLDAAGLLWTHWLTARAEGP